MNFCLLFTSDDGVPGRLEGPGTMDECVETLKLILEAKGEKIPENLREQVESDFIFDLPDGNTVHVLVVEPLGTYDEALRIQKEDDEEQKRRDEKHGLHGDKIDDAN